MSKTIGIVGLVLVLALCAGAVMLYLAYAIAEAPPSRVRTDGISDSARVITYDNGASSIQASNREDAAAALGYLHAQEHAWSMALWRRTATGRLSEWFGDALLPLDRMTRRLGIGQVSQRAYATLPAGEQATLAAYARGVNAAIRSEEARLSSEFVALETVPEAWEPWHSLAVERLFAWLAADRPDPDSLRQAPRAMKAFFDADDRLRRWLHLHGFDQSFAWTLEDSIGTLFAQRHVYGASALPIFHEVEISWAGSEPLIGATLIGTPFMPAGRSSSQAWAVLLSSRIRLNSAVRDTTEMQPVYDRLRSAGGREHLIRVQRTVADIFFPARRLPAVVDSLQTDATRAGRAGGIPPARIARPAEVPHPASGSADAPSQSEIAPGGSDVPSRGVSPGWVLEWSGFRPLSDAPAWRALAEGDAVEFQLIEGDGLVFSRDTGARVIGTPLFSMQLGGGIAVGNSEWGRFAAERLDSLAAGPDLPLGAADAVNDRQSMWAAALAPPLTEAAIAVPNQPGLVTDALTYLRNWDYAYDRASIAASIFEIWMKVYRDSLHQLPEGAVPDTALGEILVRYEALVRGVERLSNRHGGDPSQWRWEEVQPRTYYFPAWSSDTLLFDHAGSLPRTRYRPVDVPGSGHPTTLFYGPSPLVSDLGAPATWESWVSTSSWETYRFRTRRFPANRFFGRYLVSDRPPAPAQVPDPQNVHYAVTLLPQ